MSVVVLGLDQSYTSSGVCIFDCIGTLGVFDIIRSDPTMDFFDRANLVATEVANLCVHHAVTHIFMEGLAFGGFGNAGRQLSGLQYVVVTTLRRLCPTVICDILAPTTIKKFAVGSGKASKTQMIAAVPNEVRQRFIDAGISKTKGLGDVCDAYHIGLCGAKKAQLLC